VEKADEYRILLQEFDDRGKFSDDNSVKRTLKFPISEGTIKDLEPGKKYNIFITGVRNGNSGKALSEQVPA